MTFVDSPGAGIDRSIGLPRKTGSLHVDSAQAFGARLKGAREAAGLTQRALSFPGCSFAYISRMEAGERIASLQVIHELARRVNVSPEWLATGREGEVEPLTEAETALRLGDSASARALFGNVLESESPTAIDRARALAGLGQLAFLGGEIAEAIDRLKEAEELWPTVITGTNAETLGRAYATSGDEESALALFRRQFELATEAGDLVEIRRFSVLLANTYIDLARFDQATALLADIIEQTRELTDPIARARVYWTQSRLHSARGQSELAAQYARRALESVELTENLTYLARAHRLLGYVELEAGRPQEALEILRRGELLLDGSGSDRERVQFRLEEARALAALGDMEEAASLAMSAAAAFSAEGHPVDLGRTFGMVARSFHERGDLARAQELYELAIEILESQPNPLIAGVYANFGELLEQEGRLGEALQIYKKAAKAQAELSRPRES